MSYKTIFTVARMNPPTPGHFELIQKMLEEAIRHNVKKIHIILSSKTDSVKNPLEPEEKKYLLETYGIPWIRRQLKGMSDEIEVNIIMTHEHNVHNPNNIWSSIKFVLNQNKGRSLFISGDEYAIPFDDSVDVLLLDRKKNPISGTLVRGIGYLSLPALESIYKPFGMCQKEVYILYNAIRQLDPPNENISKMARKIMKERYYLRLRPCY